MTNITFIYRQKSIETAHFRFEANEKVKVRIDVENKRLIIEKIT